MAKNLYIQLPARSIAGFLMGVVIGVACVTPGLSGGVIAAASGIYEPALRAIVDLPREFRRGCRLLIPLGLGGAVGVMAFSQAMRQLMAVNGHAVLYAFYGMVLGSLPALVKEGGRDGFKPTWLLATAGALAAIVSCGPLLAGLARGAGEGALTGYDALMAGGVFAFGTVIPGVSASFILMAMGLYQRFLASIAELRLASLATMGAGFFIIALASVKLAEWLFRACRGPAYFAVIGLLIGSMAIAFPGVRCGWALALDLALLSGGGAMSWAATRLQGNGD